MTGYSYEFLVVFINGERFEVPVKIDPVNPQNTQIGPIPTRVLEDYEIVAVPVQFLLRRDRPKMPNHEDQPGDSSPPGISSLLPLK